MSTGVEENVDRDSGEIESLEDFRERARTWIQANLERLSGSVGLMMHTDTTDDEELAMVQRNRDLQRKLFDGGLAGVCYPKEYGGQGLTPAHQTVLNEELAGYEYPARLQIPTMVPCAAIILDFGTHEQKLEHLPKILSGEEIWIQFLSEPTGGSDVAGAITTAVRDGDEWILNGTKVWSSGAWWSDWALCLARTNWDAPKHRGLSVFMLPLDREGVDIRRIEMSNGVREFCEDFLTDVRVPDSDRLGDVNEGWTVGSRWMMHERMAHNSPLLIEPKGVTHGRAARSLVAAADRRGLLEDPLTRDRIAEDRMLAVVGGQLNQRIGEGIASGEMHQQSSAVSRLYAGMTSARRNQLTYDLAGEDAAHWAEQKGGPTPGLDYLVRQSGSIGGGTTEIARNVIAERVLGMPREAAPGKDVPFREVPRG